MRDLKARVMLYLDKHQGTRIYLTNMASELDEEPRRVQQCISHVKRQHNYPIEVVNKGHTWNMGYLENQKTDNRTTYTEVTNLKNGGVLLERQDGALFRANLTEVD